MPGSISFLTTPEGSVTPSTALTLDKAKLATFAGNIQMSGNTIIGNTTSGGNLTLQSTSNATRGDVVIDDMIELGPNHPNMAANYNDINFSPTFTYNPTTGTITNNFINYAPTATVNQNVAAITGQNALFINPSVTFSQGLAYIYTGLQHSGTFTMTANPAFANTFRLFVGNPTITSSTAGVTPMAIVSVFSSSPILDGGNANVTSGGKTFAVNYLSNATYQNTGASAVLGASVDVGYDNSVTLKANTSGGAVTLDARYGVRIKDASYTSTGTTTLTDNIGYKFENQSQTSGNRTVTTIKALSLEQNSGASTTWNIFASGSADNAIAGNVRIGDTTAPGLALDVAKGFGTRDETVTQFTADNTTVTVGNRSYLKVSSNNATATNRTFILTQGVAGQRLVIQNVSTGTNKVELIDDSAQSGGGNHRLASTWASDQYDTIELIFDGTDWIEISRSTN